MYHTYTFSINCRGRFGGYTRRILAFPRKMIHVQVDQFVAHRIFYFLPAVNIVFVMSGNRLSEGR